MALHAAAAARAAAQTRLLLWVTPDGDGEAVAVVAPTAATELHSTTRGTTKRRTRPPRRGVGWRQHHSPVLPCPSPKRYRRLPVSHRSRARAPRCRTAGSYAGRRRCIPIRIRLGLAPILARLAR